MVKHVVLKRCRCWDGSGGGETNNSVWVGDRTNECLWKWKSKVAKIVCTKGHKVIESKKRSLNDCQNSLHA